MSDIIVGKVRCSHGLKGEVKVDVIDRNEKRFFFGRKLFLGEKKIPVTVKTYKDLGLTGILAFEEFTHIDQLKGLLPAELYSLEEDLPKLEKDQYYLKDLLGSSIIDEDGIEYGILENILFYNNDVYEIRTRENKLVYFPAVEKETILRIDLENKQITIRPIEGIFDED